MLALWSASKDTPPNGVLQPYEMDKKNEGNRPFTPYLEDPVNYWEVFGKLAQRFLASRIGSFRRVDSEAY